MAQSQRRGILVDEAHVGRFSRMRGVHHRIWAPPESRVWIEYSNEVLRELRLGSANADAGGILFGTRRGTNLRVLAARCVTENLPDTKDPRLAGLEPLGIFAARARGEVFLTEADLHRFEEAKISNGVALVVAGARGGFFVPEPDGSFQTIRSYEEFAIADGPPLVEPTSVPKPENAPVKPPSPPSPVSFIPKSAWLVLGCLTALIVPVEAHFRWGWTQTPPPLGLTVRGQANQFTIAWNPALIGRRGRLEIVDGAQRSTLPLSGTLANATYAPETNDVEVRLVVEDGGSLPRSEIARVVGQAPQPSPEIESARAQIASLEAEAAELRTASEKNRNYYDTLEAALRALTRAQ